MRVDDVGSHLVGDAAGRGRQRGDETRHEQRSARSTRGRHEPAAVREPLEPLGGIARPHDLDVAESLTQWQRRVVGSDDGDDACRPRLAHARGRGGTGRRGRPDGAGTTRSRGGPGTTPAGTIRPRHEPSRRCRRRCRRRRHGRCRRRGRQPGLRCVRAPVVRARRPLLGGVRRRLRALVTRLRGDRRVPRRARHRGEPQRRVAVRARRAPASPARCRSASVARRDRGRRGHRGRRRRDDGDERVGAEPARAVDARSRHLPHHRQVAVRAEPAPDRRGSRAVRDVRRREPGLRARLLPRGLSRRPVEDGRSAAPVRPPLPGAAGQRRLARRQPARGSRARARRRPRVARAVRARESMAAALGGGRCDGRRRRVVAAGVLQPRHVLRGADAAVPLRRHRARGVGDDRRARSSRARVRRGHRARRVGGDARRRLGRARRAPLVDVSAVARLTAPQRATASLPRHRHRDRDRDRDRRPLVAQPPVLRPASQRDPVAGRAVRPRRRRRRRRRARASSLALDACAPHALAAARCCDRIGAHGRGRRVRMVRASPPRDDDRGAEQPGRVPAASGGRRRRLGASLLRALDGVAVLVPRPGHTRARRHRRRDRGVVGHPRTRTPLGAGARARRVPRPDGPVPLASARGARPDVGDAPLPPGDDPGRRPRVLRRAGDDVADARHHPPCRGRARRCRGGRRARARAAAGVAHVDPARGAGRDRRALRVDRP